METAVEGDLCTREIEMENQFLKDIPSEDSRRLKGPEIKLEKLEYVIIRNPREFP